MRIYLALIFSFLAILYFLSACVTIKPPVKPLAALAWNKPEWDAVLTASVLDEVPAFEKASDIELWCPGFKKMDLEHKIYAISTMAVAIAKRESGYNPGSVYEESNGVDSIGLFQLSYGDSNCPKTKAQGSLTDPAINIRCAVHIMGDLVAKDGIIASGGYVKYGAPPAKGAARYWSVLRSPDSKSKHHKAEIMSAMKSVCN